MNRAALDLQLATFRRSRAAAVVTPLAVLAPPCFGLLVVLLARSGAMSGPSAARFAPYAEGSTAAAIALLTGQIATVVTLLATGFATTWLFGREWADRTYGSLFALAVSRSRIGAAKVVLLAAWTPAIVTASTALVIAGIAAVDPGGLTVDVWRQIGRGWLAALLMGLLGLPFGWAAVRSRGYLGPVGALIAVTAAGQILASLGWGPWVPYVAPALWAGAGGAAAADDVGAIHLVWGVAVALAGAAAAVRAFGTSHLDR